MNIKTLLILVSLLFLSCSKRNKFYKEDKIILSQIELQEIKDINIYKYGKFLFYAYLKNGLELVKVSREQLETKVGEEVIQVFENGYYPIYPISRDRQHSFCGSNSISNYNQINYDFCKSHYLENAYLSSAISDEIAGAIATFGIYNLATGDKHIAKFDHEKFKKYIVKSRLPKFKKIISKNLTRKYPVYIVSKIIPHQLENNIIKISSLEEKISGLILSDKNNNIYDIIKFDKLKNKIFFNSVSNLTQQLVDAYLKPNQFLIDSSNSNITLNKRISETTKEFKKRVRYTYQQEKKKKKRVERLILKEQRYKKSNIEKFLPYFTQIALQALIGNLYVKAMEYDFHKQTFFLKINSSNSIYSKEVFFKSNPIQHINKHDIKPIITYEFLNKNLVLQTIDVWHNKDIYQASIGNFEKSIAIQVTIKMNIDESLSKDNLPQTLIKIDEKISDNFLNFEDDIPPLIDNIDSVKADYTKWLFVIGAEKYDNTDDVIYSKRSSKLFSKVLQKSLGIADRNAYLLIGEKATSGAIEDRLNRMLENIKEGDSLYFFYSGHGIPVLPNRIPYLLPKDKIPDYIGKSPFFKLNNIYNLLSNSKASKVIAIMDSCFSGSTDGKSIFKGVAGSVLVPKKVTFNHRKMVVLTAGREKQFSNMYPQRGHRLFSYFVMKALLEGKRDIKSIYNEVFSNVQSVSNGFGDLKRQEPTIEGNEKLKF